MYSPPVTEAEMKTEKLPELPTPETVKAEIKPEALLIFKQEAKQEPNIKTPKKLKKSLLSDYSKSSKNVPKVIEQFNHNFPQKQVITY